MKLAILLVVAFIGLASAAAIQSIVPIDDGDVTQAIPNMKKRLVEALESGLEDIIKRIKARADAHHQNSQDLVEKSQEYVDRLRQLGQDVGETVKTLIEKNKASSEVLWDELAEKLGTNKVNVPEVAAEQEDAIEGQEQGTFRTFMKELRGTAKGHFTDFAEWLRGHWSRVSDHAKDKHEQWTNVAKEVRDHAKEMHKSAVREAVEALRPHREELGALWREVLESAKNAFRSKPTK